jgi:hypothetical protein
MSGEQRTMQLLITIALGTAADDVTIERITIHDAANPVPSIPAFAKAVCDDDTMDVWEDCDDFRARKRLAQCLLMDQFEIDNGDKAIAIALHRHWNPDLGIIFGRPDSPSSIKRWRSQRGKPTRRRLIDMRDRASRPVRRRTGSG